MRYRDPLGSLQANRTRLHQRISGTSMRSVSGGVCLRRRILAGRWYMASFWWRSAMPRIQSPNAFINCFGGVQDVKPLI
jgi:hypothetical protein